MKESKILIRITSAAELEAALNHPEIAVRSAVTAHIADAPEEAQAFGSFQGRDVVDMLLARAKTCRNRAEESAILCAFRALPDIRLAHHCTEVLLHSTDDRRSILAYNYLSSLELFWDRSRLRPLLWENDRATNAELASRLLQGEILEPAECTRVCAILGRPTQPQPTFAAEALTLWLNELGGCWSAGARDCLMDFGETASSALIKNWNHLNDESQRWLVDWVVRKQFSGQGAVVALALESTDPGVVIAGLSGYRAIADPPLALGRRAHALLGHAEPAVREAAIRAGAAPSDWDDMLKTETAPRVISACLRGAASQLGSKAIPVLVRFLQHEQWQVVAAATELLAGLGKDGAAAVAPLLDDAKLSVRVAADRILGAAQSVGSHRATPVTGPRPGLQK